MPTKLLSTVPAIAMILAVPLLAGPAAAAEPAIHDGPSPPVVAWTKAMEAGDLAALGKMNGPDTTAFPPGTMQLKGDAIAKDYEGLFSKYTVKVANDEAHWIEEGPLVISWGLTTLTLHPKTGTGKDVTTKTRFTDVATKAEGGGWRYIVDQASVPIGP